MTDLVGNVLGRYRLVELLGQGATARVYRAHLLDDDAQVAVKVLHPHLTMNPETVSRFERETRAAATLNHPSIVRVIDCGREGNFSYLVMSLFEGPTLKEYLREQPAHTLPVTEAVTLAARLADALEYAHHQGVIHRDVKPSNVLLPGGDLTAARLTDFGVAYMTEATVETASGTTLGTPAYMSPEQGQSKPADVRSDVYALGAVLFELLTGRPPFQAESPYAMIMHHIHTPPPSPRSLRPDVPAAVEAVILRALAKDPAARYPTAAAFAAALRQSLRQPEPVAPPRWSWLLASAMGVALLLIVVLIGWRAGWLQAIRYRGLAAADVKPVTATLILQGPPAVRGAWPDPGMPDRIAYEDPKVHLQGPSTPDRIAYRLILPALPEDTAIVTATLSLYTAPWGEDNRYATVALHRLLRDWSPITATYVSPWTSPGLSSGVDYEAEPLLRLELDDRLHNEGWLDLDVTGVVREWLAGRPNYGVMVHMTDDSFGMAHLWVYTSEYEDPDLRPKLTLVYGQ